MKIGQHVFVIKNRLIIHAVITNKQHTQRKPVESELSVGQPYKNSVFRCVIDILSCQQYQPFEYEVMYNDNTREIIQETQLEKY